MPSITQKVPYKISFFPVIIGKNVNSALDERNVLLPTL